MKKLKAILIGAGSRGIGYTDIMAELPDKFEVVAVAEPIENRREYIKNKHNINEEFCFDDWKPLLELGKIADVAVICTMDRDHYDVALKAIDLGYDMLLEKPVTPEPEECYEIVHRAEEKGVRIVVCHVLRYTPLYMKIKDIIDDGKLGRIMSINHEECVGNLHQSHSFVRGNWGNSKKTSTMLLQKTCHDMDILQWLLNKKCKKVQSYGKLSYFTKENAPEGSPDYCVQGCPVSDSCPYYSVKVYLDDKDNHWFRSTCTKNAEPTDELVEEAIRNTQYGKCVFKCDNDVVDHQTVNLLFEDDITVTFTMNAFNKGGRFIHIMGTKGELHASSADDAPYIKVYDFETKETTEIPMTGVEGINGGHGGGDEGIINALYDYITDCYTGKSIPTFRQSCDNHAIVFAAEKAREDGIIVDIDEFIKSFE